MVLDQIFGHLESHQDTDLSYLNNSTEPLCEMSMDLDDFKFDFDTLSDNLGGWIDVADSKVTGTPAEYADAMLKSDSSIDFDDLKLTEAVRYDCMWSSNPSTHNTISQTTICENNLLDEFLKLMDNSAANFELDLDIKEEVATNPQKKVVVDPLACDRLQQPDSDDITDKCSDVRIFTSLDHSYVSRNVPTSVDKTSRLPSTYPMTPPESSEDEDTSSSISSPSATIITRNTSAYPKFVNVPGGGIYTSTSQQSLLKKRNSASLSRPRSSGSSQGSGEAKFCLKVKLSTDPSRSLLKQQKLRLVKSSSNHKSDSSPSTSPSSSSFSTSAKKSSSTRIMSKASLIQTSIRRRKEESLKQKHDEAREIHNHMERQRRNELKLAFDELKACMPDIANSDKVSKQMILDTALTNCRLLRSREVSLKQRRDKLKKSHAELQRKLTALHEKRLGMTTTTSASPSSTNRFSSIATNQL